LSKRNSELNLKYENRRYQGMESQESEARKREIVRQMGRLADDLKELEHEASDKETEKAKESLLDLYVPRGLRNIHRLPKPML